MKTEQTTPIQVGAAITSEEDEKIEQFARLAKPSIVAVGLGGAGCNVVTWVKERGITGGKLVSVNTDATHLRISKADRRILIGEKLTKGLGCGGYPELGEKALHESADSIVKEISEANIIFLVAGLGEEQAVVPSLP